MAIRRWPKQAGYAVLMSLFWIWGAFGLIGNLASLNSEIGVAALSSQLLWIGGMLLFGLGALLIRPAAEDTAKQENAGKELPLSEATDS